MLFVALLLSLAPSLVQAQTASERIIAGRVAYESLDYEAAMVELEAALRVSSISQSERARALETLAFVLTVLDREDDARERLVQLFALDAYYDVREPTGSPIIQSLVDRVRGEVVADAALVADLTVRMELPSSARADRPISTRVHVRGEGASRVAEVRIRHRGVTEIDWSSTSARRDGASFVVELPALGRVEPLELYAEARDERGRLLARSAGPLAPSVLEVTEGSGGSSGGENVLESWWLWTIVGVVVVGAGIGIGVGVASGDGQAPGGTLSPGRVILP
jgi:hypothetical protein